MGKTAVLVPRPITPIRPEPEPLPYPFTHRPLLLEGACEYGVTSNGVTPKLRRIIDDMMDRKIEGYSLKNLKAVVDYCNSIEEAVDHITDCAK